MEDNINIRFDDSKESMEALRGIFLAEAKETKVSFKTEDEKNEALAIYMLAKAYKDPLYDEFLYHTCKRIEIKEKLFAKYGRKESEE